MGIRGATLCLSVCAVIASVSGCSGAASGAPSPSVGTAGPFAASVREAIADADAGGASDWQSADLANILASGTVELEVARVAMRRTVDCINATGVQAQYVEQTVDGTVVVPTLTYGGKTSGDAEYAQCSRQESYWVDYLYQTQPSAREAREIFLTRQLPVVTKCLETNGFPVSDEEDMLAILTSASQTARDTGGQVDCLAEADIVAF